MNPIQILHMGSYGLIWGTFINSHTLVFRFVLGQSGKICRFDKYISLRGVIRSSRMSYFYWPSSLYGLKNGGPTGA